MPIIPSIVLLFAVFSERAATLGQAAPDLSLFDARGAAHHLADVHGPKGTVVYFFATGCPLTKLYTPRLDALARQKRDEGIAFLGVSSQPTDSLSDIEAFSRTHRLGWPLWKDRDGQFAARMGVKRTPEVLLFDAAGRLRYRGRIDDQYRPGNSKPAPSTNDLQTALAELLSGRAISRPLTEPAGCLLGRQENSGKTDVDFARHIAPILQRNCQSCHRPGQVGPFSLTTYQEASSWGAMIREVVASGRMPPWHANPAHGRFANDRRLSEADKSLIKTWVDNGCPEGDRTLLKPAPAFPEEWSFQEPDCILSLPAPVQVPAEGTVDYQFFEVDPGFTEDQWIQSAEVLPTCRSVVHHCNIFLKPPTRVPLDRSTEAEWTYLTVLTPGKSPAVLPPGAAKRWPAGWKAVFVIHYSPNGTPQIDQTRLGLVFADPAKVRKEVRTHFTWDVDLAIPPGAGDHQVSHKFACDDDLLLYAIFPHMHLRGKSFRTEAEYPDGRREILLDVPRYDFAWQNHYVFAEPLRLPRGTILHFVSTYDNSSANPANPDPTVWVRTGQQSWDEMFNVYLDISLAEQDIQLDGASSARRGMGLLSILGVGGLTVLQWRMRRARRARALHDCYLAGRWPDIRAKSS